MGNPDSASTFIAKKKEVKIAGKKEKKKPVSIRTTPPVMILSFGRNDFTGEAASGGREPDSVCKA